MRLLRLLVRSPINKGMFGSTAGSVSMLIYGIIGHQEIKRNLRPTPHSIRAIWDQYLLSTAM